MLLERFMDRLVQFKNNVSWNLAFW